MRDEATELREQEPAPFLMAAGRGDVGTSAAQVEAVGTGTRQCRLLYREKQGGAGLSCDQSHPQKLPENGGWSSGYRGHAALGVRVKETQKGARGPGHNRICCAADRISSARGLTFP